MQRKVWIDIAEEKPQWIKQNKIYDNFSFSHILSLVYNQVFS